MKKFLALFLAGSVLFAQDIAMPGTFIFPKTIIGQIAGAYQPFYHQLAGSGNSVTVSLTVPASTILLIEMASTQYVGLAATFNSVSCNIDAQVNTGTSQTWQSNDSVALFSCQVASPTTANAVISWTTSSPFIIQFATITTGNLQGVDKTATGFSSGATTAPATSATSTTTYASEVAVSVMAMNHATLGGNWQNSFVDDQHIPYAASIVIDSGYLYLTTTQTVTGSKTGTTSGSWGAIVATYRL